MRCARSRSSVLALALFVAGSALPAQSNAGSVTAAPTFGAIHGTVFTEKTERPLLNAQVSISKLALAVRTDSSGNFLLKDVPYGTHDVMVRLDGFEPLFTEITVVKGEKVGYDLMLKERIIQYAPKGARKETVSDISRMGLDERRNNGTGHFITEDVVREYAGKPTADLIKAKVPELHAVKIAGKDARAIAMNISDPSTGKIQPSENDRKEGAKADCYVPVVLNSTVMYQSVSDLPLFDVNSIPSGMIMSVEYFTVTNIPAQFAVAVSPCGLLSIKTRGR